MRKIIFLLSLFALFNCITEINEDVEIHFYMSDKKYDISKEKGIIDISSTSSYNIFDDEDLEEHTNFNISIKADSGSEYPLKCRLWKEDSTYIWAFCNFQESLKINKEIITKDVEQTFQYNNTNVKVKFHFSNIQLNQLEGNIPFLYSTSKTINVQENDQKVYFEFKCDSYHDELLFIRTNEKIPRIVELENCNINGKNLKCEVPKVNLDVIANITNKFIVIYITELKQGDFLLVPTITINYPTVQKEEISFNLGDVVENPVYYNSFITFNTDAKMFLN